MSRDLLRALFPWLVPIKVLEAVRWLPQHPRTGIDPDYFSPLEVAWAMHRPLSGNFNARTDDHVAGLAFANMIAPGATNSLRLFERRSSVGKPWLVSTSRPSRAARLSADCPPNMP